MPGLFETIRHRATQRVAYTRILRELEAMSHSTACDLDLDQTDFKTIARRAVYGR